MPPILFAALSFPFTRLAYALFPVAIANGIISGAFGFCELHFIHPYHTFTNGHSLNARRSLRLHALRIAPHQAPSIHARNEEIPSCASLQEL